jgi:hypothetical protein
MHLKTDETLFAHKALPAKVRDATTRSDLEPSASGIPRHADNSRPITCLKGSPINQRRDWRLI